MLTASYPLGHLPYGWLNTLKPVPPAFQQVSTVVMDAARHPQLYVPEIPVQMSSLAK